MTTRIAITAVIFMMVQAVLFGIGVTVILATPLSASADTLLPAVVLISIAVGLPFSWWLAPRLRARYWQRPRPDSGDRAIEKLS